MTNRIDSIESLDKEILRLQAKAKGLEQQLDTSLDYLQDNYSSMIMNSVFSPVAAGIKGGVWGAIFSFFLGNEKLMEALSKMADHLLKKLTGTIEKLADRWARKKDD